MTPASLAPIERGGVGYKVPGHVENVLDARCRLHPRGMYGVDHLALSKITPLDHLSYIEFRVVREEYFREASAQKIPRVETVTGNTTDRESAERKGQVVLVCAPMLSDWQPLIKRL